MDVYSCPAGGTTLGRLEILAGVLRSEAGAFIDARAAAQPGGELEAPPPAQLILDHHLGRRPG